VAESSEVAGRHAPFVTQAPPETSRTDGWTRRAQIGVKIAFRERLELGLVVHVLAASGQQQHGDDRQRRCLAEVQHS
jgi:hypothetical protein